MTQSTGLAAEDHHAVDLGLRCSMGAAVEAASSAVTIRRCSTSHNQAPPRLRKVYRFKSSRSKTKQRITCRTPVDEAMIEELLHEIDMMWASQGSRPKLLSR